MKKEKTCGRCREKKRGVFFKSLFCESNVCVRCHLEEKFFNDAIKSFAPVIQRELIYEELEWNRKKN